MLFMLLPSLRSSLAAGQGRPQPSVNLVTHALAALSTTSQSTFAAATVEELRIPSDRVWDGRFII
jgi:hypothetical protein